MTIYITAPHAVSTSEWLRWTGTRIVRPPDYFREGDYLVVCAIEVQTKPKHHVLVVLDNENELLAALSPFDRRPHTYYLVHISDILDRMTQVQYKDRTRLREMMNHHWKRNGCYEY